MAAENDRNVKVQALQRQGVFNRRAERVKDDLFHEDEFFDARDLVQVKYEMLRRAKAEGETISKTAKAFGFSRVSFYRAQKAVTEEGLAGLAPKRRGPQRRYKVTAEVLKLLREEREKDPSIHAGDLCALVKDRFGISIHPRTIGRALRSGKKGALRKAVLGSRTR